MNKKTLLEKLHDDESVELMRATKTLIWDVEIGKVTYQCTQSYDADDQEDKFQVYRVWGGLHGVSEITDEEVVEAFQMYINDNWH